MRDPRTRQLAKLIVNHSCELKAGEAVLIESFDLADGLVLDLIEETQAVGAIPVVSIRDNAVIRAQLRGASEAQLKVQAEIELHQMKQVQAYSRKETRLKLDVDSERAFYASQTGGISDLIFYLGWPLAIGVALLAAAAFLFWRARARRQVQSSCACSAPETTP